MLRDDAGLRGDGRQGLRARRDISRVSGRRCGLKPRRRAGLAVAYHAACSLQHGQRDHAAAEGLARTLGFTVKDVPDGHLCCGSAGTYNILQPEIASKVARAQGRDYREDCGLM